MELLNLLLAFAGFAFVSTLVFLYLRFRKAHTRQMRLLESTPGRGTGHPPDTIVVFR